MSEPRPRPVIFGEVLFDCFPDGSRVLGGAPFNVAWHLQAFGLAPLFVSRIGEDPPGDEITAAMASWGMDRGGLQRDPFHATGSVEVSFDDGEPHYRIVEGRAYDRIDPVGLPEIAPGSLLYHGTLVQRDPVSRAALEQFRERFDGAIFLDVNLRPPWWQRERLIAQLGSVRWLKLNADEFVTLAGELSPRGMVEAYGLELLLLTRGGDGAELWSRDPEPLRVRPRPGELVDTVGAGDAFASVMLAGIWLRWPLATALERAQEFASALVGVRGATVSERAFYEPFIAGWSLTD